MFNKERIYQIRFYVTLLISLMHAISGVAQNIPTKEIADRLFYENIGNLISLKLGTDADVETFDVKGDGFEYDIRPNAEARVRLMLDYRFISFKIAYLAKFLPGNNDDSSKGTTQGLGFGLKMHVNHFLLELRYRKLKGFYLHNTSELVPDWNKEVDPYIQFPDFKVKSYMLGLSYKLNPHFSLKALDTQSEIQKISTGSIIPGIQYDKYATDNRSKSESQQSSQRSETEDIYLNIGYYYTFVYHASWYMSLGASPGVGLSYTDLLTRYPERNINSNYHSFVYRVKGQLGFGYNSKRFFAGVGFNVYREFNRRKNSSVAIIRKGNFAKVFVGYRFNEPKSLKRFSKKIKGFF